VSVSHPDPAARHEYEQLAEECRAYLNAFETDDVFAVQVQTGRIMAQTANVWKLYPGAGILDPIKLFERPGETCVRTYADEADDG
jgi:hypothetical protein